MHGNVSYVFKCVLIYTYEISGIFPSYEYLSDKMHPAAFSLLRYHGVKPFWIQYDTWAELQEAAESGEMEMKTLVKAVDIFGPRTGAVVQAVERALVSKEGSRASYG